MIPRVLERTIELPIGLEEDGVVHRDLVLGPLTVRGSYQAEAWALQPHPDMPAQAWRGMCRMAAQVRR
ncbi:MAG TPA: hypothetical protein PLA94_33350, partial [Myxococcota bacterium]|nr:hypothetical protein [Myxococcota bacterium]